INRQLYTPVIAVMKFARHAYQPKRPEGHDNLPALDVPANDWYPAVVRAANPYLRAFLIVQRMTGRRPDELLNRSRDHYVRETGALMVWDGKESSSFRLSCRHWQGSRSTRYPICARSQKGPDREGPKAHLRQANVPVRDEQQVNVAVPWLRTGPASASLSQPGRIGIAD